MSEVEKIFENAIEWLKNNYNNYNFYLERDIVWIVQKKLLDLFSNLRRHVLLDCGKEIKCFYDLISTLQEQILDLFIASKDNYTG